MNSDPRREPQPSADPQSGEDTAPQTKRKRSHGSEQRQREKIISVRCKKSEAALIEANAATLDLCASAFLRVLGTGQRRGQERRRPLPELLPFTQAMGRLGIYASNAHQLLKLLRFGEDVRAGELEAAAHELRQAAEELLRIIREYSE